MPTTTLSSHTDRVEQLELLDARTEALGADADSRTEELHRARRLPDDVFRAIARAGLFRQLVPTDIGGLGRTPIEWFRTGMVLSRHEASLGWVVTQGAAELGWIGAGADDEWAREVLADPDAASASSVAGLGSLAVDGDRGRLTGSWAFNTGCHGATWIGGLALAHRDGNPRDVVGIRIGWVPAERAAITESWDPSGLHGTGSHTTHIRDEDIPMTWSVDPFTPTANDRGPYRSLVGNGNWPIAASVAATQLGTARRALDTAAGLVTTKAATPDLVVLADNAAVQRGLADVEGRWLGAVAAVERELEAMWDEARTNGELSSEQRVRLHRANLAASRCAVDLVDRVVDLTGTTAVDRHHVLSRCQRDAHALRGHVSVGGAAMEHNTKVALGLEPSHRLV
jgi:indole-3-acetate monooxygenase